MRHGNRNVRLGLAHAARYLVHLACLLPDAIDLPQAARDIDKLAAQLENCACCPGLAS